MLTAEDVRNVMFSRSARGYKTVEVDDFLEQVMDTISQLVNENAELSRKLEVLADRIQEYRNEEDSIRSALLAAQKSADKILKEANDEKEQMLNDARQQADDALRLSQEKSMTIANETREKVALVLNEAKDKATTLLKDAKEKSDNILTEAIEGCQNEKRYLEFLKEQETSFRQQLVEMYKKQFELLKKGPELIKELDHNLAQQPEPVSIPEPAEEIPEEVQVEDVPVAQDITEAEQAPEQETADIADTYVDPEDIPLPIAEKPAEVVQESTVSHGFEVKSKFSDLKFGDDYDIASDDDYEDYGV